MKNDGFVWDQWQKDVLEHEGNVVIRSGRQVGKSVVIAEKAVRFAVENSGTVTLVIAASQRQSGLLFEKIKAGGKGGRPGQWSARKAQMLAKKYKAKGGGYRTSK